MHDDCHFRWTPYRADARMGLNHQMSSLSCAINEASFLGRTLVLPSRICTDSGHNRGEVCPTFASLFDVDLLSRLVSQTGPDPDGPGTLSAQVVTYGHNVNGDRDTVTGPAPG